MELTQEYLLRRYKYDKHTGLITRRSAECCNKFKKGSIVGTKKSNGYIQLKINYRSYFAHRVIWMVMHGKWPKNQIDHINGIRDDNRLSNLREATHAQNMQNAIYSNKTGFRGVRKSGNKFRAQIRYKGKLLSLGTFNTAEDASKAYFNKSKEIHGDFSFSKRVTSIQNICGKCCNVELR